MNDSLRPFYNEWVRPNLPGTKKEWIKFWIYIVIVFSVCAIGINQLIELLYNVQLLQTPCELCESFGNTCTRKMVMNFTGFVLP